MVTPYPVKFNPIPKERIWGGHKLKEWFGYKGKEPIGEYWVLSSHPNGMSVVSNGEFKGMTLQELTDQYPEYYLGNSPQKRFPLLIKFLDITQDLSVQVHPDDEYAQRHEGDFGKTEAWYILDTKEDGSIIYGHHFKNKEKFHRAVEEKKVKDYLNYVPIKPGQSILVPSGTLHALRADTTLVEIQQTSDVTYRVYDWDRVDCDGNARELHVKKAGEVLEYDHTAIPVNIPVTIYQTNMIQQKQLLQSPYFCIEELSIKEEYTLSVNGANPDLLVIVKGKGILYDSKNKRYPLKLNQGDSFLIPNSVKSYSIYTTVELIFLRIYYK